MIMSSGGTRYLAMGLYDGANGRNGLILSAGGQLMFSNGSAAEDPFMKLAADSRAKSSMKDIIAKPAPVGPTDEIRSFGLTDFRRLSSKPEEAALRLKQKFINLQGESIFPLK
jgi:hypothetical protein